MTHRQGEPFTIKNLNTIKETINQKKIISASGVGSSINASYQPFYEFTPDFIDATTIQKLRDGEPAIPKELYKNVDAVGFFDSLHDFKSDFMDCQGNIRGISNSWNYKKFGFTFLLNGGYSNLLEYDNLLIQRAYSYLNRIPRPLNQDNLENYFSIGNIYDTIATEDNSKGNIYILPNTRESITDKTTIYNTLIGLFAKYKDTNFNNKIKLVFDFQLNLFDIIQVGRRNNENNDGFCVLYTAEIMTDPAPKPKAAKIDEIFGCDNWYIEILNKSRSYDAEYDNVRGNVNVSFNKIEFSKENDLENAEFSVNVTYSNEDQNETIDVKMNSKSNTIQNIKNMIRNTIEKLTNVSDRFDYYKDSINDRISFYKKFNSETLSEQDANNYKKKYTRYFARKRLGDTLEGRVCKKDKQEEVQFKNVIKESKSGIVRNKTSYKLSDNIINLTDEASIKDAVLVTHDRMLFSYAVINKIPTILDLQEHMILFIPPEEQTGGSGKPGPFSNQPHGPFSDQPSVSLSAHDGGDNGDDDDDDDDDDKILIKKQYNTELISVGDTKIVIESIKRNVGDAIYYIYHQIDGIQEFLKKVNIGLQNNTLEYAYLGEYFNNALIILPSENFEQRVEYIKSEIQKSIEVRNTRYNSLLYNNLLLFIQTSDNSILKIKNNFTQQTPTVRDENNTSRWISNMEVKFTTSSNKEKTYYYNDQDIYNFIKQIEDNNLFEMTGEIKNDILTFYQEPTNRPTTTSNMNNNNNNNNGYNKPILFITIIFALMISFKIKALFDSFMKGGAVDSVSNEETPLYVKILSADFNFLTNKKNLFEQNVTSLYCLFNLLQSYEASFIGYQEGIDAFYTKIDESYILSEMIGVTNYIPHNIEFYVFLKLLLKDYDEDKVNKINYALFEYYLYNSKQSNQIYSRFQDIKSYLLKTNYEIEITEENIQLIQNENKETLDYFDSIMKTATELSQQIINENYNAYQDSNFEKVYENVSNYNLTLKGFTDMKSEFITKTTDVISSMVNKGLLTQYASQATQEIQSSQTSKTSQTSQLMNEPKEPTLLVNTVNKEVYEKAKGIVPYKKLTPLKFENTLAYGAGKHNKQYNRTRRNSRKYRKHKKTNKNNKKNKKRTKSLKKKIKKTKTCKEK
jgi:hypothetical protein